MSLHIGIVGLPNVGKSTLFQAITKKEVDRSNYPFCTIDPNIGVVAVPDKRVDVLANLNKSLKKKYTTIEFVDIAGLVEGASRGEGLGNQFLANIRQVNAVVYVLRGFKNDKIINTQDTVDVLKDKEILDTEMALKDLETVEKRIKVLEKKLKTDNKKAKIELDVLEKAQDYLGSGKVLSEQIWTDKDKDILKSFQLLTMKPRLYLLNADENEIDKETLDIFEKNKWAYIIMDILAEFDGADLSIEERRSFGIPEKLSMENLIKKTYDLLDLITFFTTGPDETRAWTLRKGLAVPKAGGVIHSDFEKYFIKAKVIQISKLLENKGFANSQKSGLIRTEGKKYLVQDGDVIEIMSGR